MALVSALVSHCVARQTSSQHLSTCPDVSDVIRSPVIRHDLHVGCDLQCHVRRRPTLTTIGRQRQRPRACRRQSGPNAADSDPCSLRPGHASTEQGGRDSGGRTLMTPPERVSALAKFDRAEFSPPVCFFCNNQIHSCII